MSQEKKAKSNLGTLDGIRALSALYVVLHHASMQYFSEVPNNIPFVIKVVLKSLRYGNLAVGVFIVLSGFCLMLSVINADYYIRNGIALFFKKRVIRILPPYYLAMLVSIILIKTLVGDKTGTHWDRSVEFGYKDVLLHFFMLHDFFKSTFSSINHVFWSVAVEFRIYLFFPLLVYLWRKLGAFPSLGITILLSYLMSIALIYLKGRYADIALDPGVNPLIMLFVTGMLAADYSFSKRQKTEWESKIPWGLIALVTFVGFFYLSSVTYHQGVTDIYSFAYSLKNTLFAIPCFAFLVAATQTLTKPNALQKVLSVKLLVFVGTFSYSLYLLHAPLLQVITQYIIDPLGFSKHISVCILFVFCLTVIPFVCYGFYLLCERPFMTIVKNLKTRKEIIPANSDVKVIS